MLSIDALHVFYLSTDNVGASFSAMTSVDISGLCWTVDFNILNTNGEFKKTLISLSKVKLDWEWLKHELSTKSSCTNEWSSLSFKRVINSSKKLSKCFNLKKLPFSSFLKKVIQKGKLGEFLFSSIRLKSQSHSDSLFVWEQLAKDEHNVKCTASVGACSANRLTAKIVSAIDANHLLRDSLLLSLFKSMQSTGDSSSIFRLSSKYLA